MKQMKKLNSSKLELLNKMVYKATKELINNGWMSKHLMKEARQLTGSYSVREMQRLGQHLITDSNAELSTLLEFQLELVARVELANQAQKSFEDEENFEECQLIKDYITQLERIYLQQIIKHYIDFANEEDLTLISEFRKQSFEQIKKK